MIGLPSSSNNIYGVVDEEPNADTTRFFDLLKYFDEPLWNECTNHNKIISRCTIIHYQVRLWVE